MKAWFLVILILISACSAKVKPRKEHLARLQTIKSMSQFFFMDNISEEKRNSFKPLSQVYYNDQFYRDGKNYDYYRVNRKKQEALDAENQKIVGKFLDSAGFPSLKDVGFFAKFGIASTLEHAPVSFKEKYVPLMHKAIEEKNLMPSEYAIFVDKLLAQKKQMQIYGTQVMKGKSSNTLYPVNLATVTERRKEISMLETLDYYLLKNFKIKLDSAEYVKQLPSLLVKYKIDTTTAIQ